ncbi:MAG: monovalent cation/H+ antiporter complex subunit F [Zestosphaera sp.]
MNSAVLDQFIPLLIALFATAMIIYSVRVFTSKNIADATLAVDALTVDLLVIFILIALYYKSTFLLIGAVPLATWVLILDIVVARYLDKIGAEK